MEGVIYNLNSQTQVKNLTRPVYKKTTPSSTPSWLTLQTVQAWLRLNQLGSQDSVILPILIASSLDACQKYLNFDIFSTTYQASYNDVGNAYQIEKSPVDMGGISIQYFNGSDYSNYDLGNPVYTTDSSVLYDNASFRIQEQGELTTTLNPSANITVPIYSDIPPVLINFTVGYSSVSSLQTNNPSLYNALTDAMLINIAYKFTYAGDQGIPLTSSDGGLPQVAKDSLAQYRKIILNGKNNRKPNTYYSTNTPWSQNG